MKSEAEILIKLIENELSLVRHYEDQRAAVTNFVLIAVSLAVGFVSQRGLVMSSLPVAILLIILGAYGTVTVTKLYERTQFTSAFIKKYIDTLDSLYPEVNIAKINVDVRAEHKDKFPKIGKVHMYQLWAMLHIVIVIMGIAFAAITLAIR